MSTRFALALACVGALVTSAQADEADSRTKAREHYTAGKAAHDAGRYDEALREYQIAFDLVAAPELIFNMAQVQRLKGDRDAAIALYERYLATAPDGEVADEAREHLETLRASPATPTAGPTPPVPEPMRPEVGSVAPTEAPRQSGRGLRIAGIVTASIGLVATAGAIMYGLESRKLSRRLTRQNDGVWDADDIRDVNDGETAETRAFGLAGIATACIATGVVLYVVGARRSESATGVAIVPRGDGVLATAGWSF